MLSASSQRKVRRWVTLAYHNRPQMDDYEHLVHCMDHLVQNIICEADDTPMYTSSKPNIATGTSQTRMCRSWEELAQWAESQTACFGYLNETQGVNAVIQRFQYCPRDSPFAGAMKQHFGHRKDWYAKRPADIESMPKYWEDFQVEGGPTEGH